VSDQLSPDGLAAICELAGDHLANRQPRGPSNEWGRTLRALAGRRFAEMRDGRYYLTALGWRIAEERARVLRDQQAALEERRRARLHAVSLALEVTESEAEKLCAQFGVELGGKS